jgi:acetylornithine deacetylase
LRGLERVLEADFGADRVLGPATVNIGEIRGGVAQNVLAPEAEARVMVRVVGAVEDAERALRTCFADPRTGEPDPKVTIEASSMPPIRLQGLPGFPETIVAYGTDLPFLTDVGRPFLIGPGSILDAHTEAEKISKQAMAEAVERYAELARRLRPSTP